MYLQQNAAEVLKQKYRFPLLRMYSTLPKQLICQDSHVNKYIHYIQEVIFVMS